MYGAVTRALDGEKITIYRRSDRARGEKRYTEYDKVKKILTGREFRSIVQARVYFQIVEGVESY